jgi:hypothetical protein
MNNERMAIPPTTIPNVNIVTLSLLVLNTKVKNPLWRFLSFAQNITGNHFSAR